ncbi:glycosyltransferase family 2 protein [Frateuria aurantia]
MSSTTRFSVVICSYNYQAWVIEAVESALAQRRAPTQVIVVDDGSSDGSAQLLAERYGDDPRVTLVLQANGGQLRAMANGIARATGDVVCMLDSDDYWTDDYLSQLGALYDSRPEVDFVFSDLQHIGQNTGVFRFAREPVDLAYTAIVTWFGGYWYGAPTSGLSFRAALGRRLTTLPDDYFEFWRLWGDNVLIYGSSLLGAYKYYLPTGSIRYRVHGDNGWMRHHGPRRRFLNAFNNQRLFAYFGQQAGLGPRSIRLLKDEYELKPLGAWKETRRYARVARAHAESFSRRLGWPLAMIARRWRKTQP